MPRPREIEVTVLAYAPHFLGLAAAAATEKLKLKSKALYDAAANKADGSVSTSDAKADTAAAATAAARSARQKRSARRLAREKAAAQEGGVSVPTGLSVSSVWPDEEAARKKTDVNKHRADPVRVGFGGQGFRLLVY